VTRDYESGRESDDLKCNESLHTPPGPTRLQ
jgi:hypothetical protein